MQALASNDKQASLFGFQGADKSALKTQIEAQRSGFNLERRSDEVSEL